MRLRIEDLHDYPFVKSLHFDEILIQAELGGILESRFERWQLRGGVAHLVPTEWSPPPRRPLPHIHELILEPAEVQVVFGAQETSITAQAKLQDQTHTTGMEASYHGEVLLQADTLALPPWLALFDPSDPPPIEGHLADFETVWRLETGAIEAGARHLSTRHADQTLGLIEPKLQVTPGDPEVGVELVAEQAKLDFAGQTTTIEELRLVASTTATATGTLQMQLHPFFDGLRSGELDVEWDPESQRFQRLQGQFAGLDLARLRPDLGAEATIDGRFESTGERLAYQTEAVVSKIQLAADQNLTLATGATMHLAGSLPFARLATLQAPTWQGPIEIDLTVPSITVPSGSIQPMTPTLPEAVFPLRLHADGRLDSSEGLRWIGEAELDTAAAGDFEANGALRFATPEPTGDLRWTWTGSDLSGLVELAREAGWIEAPPFDLQGAVAASGRLEGTLRQPALSGSLQLQNLGLASASGSWDLDRAEATAQWSWASSQAPIRLSGLRGGGQLLLPGFDALPLTFSAKGTGTLGSSDGTAGARPSGAIESAVITAPGLATLRADGRWSWPSAGLTAMGNLAIEEVDLGRWPQLFTPLADTLGDLALTGTASTRLAGTLESSGSWQVTGPLELTAGFASGDGSRVLEGLTGHWELAAQGTSATPIELEAKGRAGGFLILWNTFFGDLSELDAAVESHLQLDLASDSSPSSWQMQHRLQVPDGPSAELDLASSEDTSSWRYDLRLDDGDLSATHTRYLAHLLEERLGHLDLEGRLALQARGHFRSLADEPVKWDLAGTLRLADLRLHNPKSQVEVVGLRLDLPFDLRRRPTPELDFSGPRLAGEVAFDRLAVRELELPPTETDLVVEADSLSLEKPIALAILGGALDLEHLTLSHLLREGRHLATAIRLAGLRLEAIADALGLFPVEGSLDGYLPAARLSPETLSVDGGGQIEIFDGIVRVHDISGEDVLTRFPKIELSADFEGIDLGQLTRRIDFGEMTGTLQGSLRDCELFRGVPVRFSARIESIEEPGVPRTVDVKAVNNISILGTGRGTGGGTSFFDRGIQRFFDKYTYSKLGVDLSLSQDVLLLRGLEQRGDKELFLRGRLPFRIDVVNAQPGKTVSFRAMVQRLKSLDFARATTER
ncbi:MAG: hypothetical protein AAF657_15155 [Acidobacteriota bacterium]